MLDTIKLEAELQITSITKCLQVNEESWLNARNRIENNATVHEHEDVMNNGWFVKTPGYISG
jgi:hypothetical protein